MPLTKYHNSRGGNAFFKEDPRLQKEHFSALDYDISYSGGAFSSKPDLHTIMINNLTTFQSFGAPYSVCDEEAIDIVYGDMLREDFDINDRLNYSVVTLMPCEVLVISKRNFLSFVKDRVLSVYKSNLITLHPDWVLRKSYINNYGWATFKKDYTD